MRASSSRRPRPRFTSTVRTSCGPAARSFPSAVRWGFGCEPCLVRSVDGCHRGSGGLHAHRRRGHSDGNDRHLYAPVDRSRLRAHAVANIRPHCELRSLAGHPQSGDHLDEPASPGAELRQRSEPLGDPGLREAGGRRARGRVDVPRLLGFVGAGFSQLHRQQGRRSDRLVDVGDRQRQHAGDLDGGVRSHAALQRPAVSALLRLR